MCQQGQLYKVSKDNSGVVTRDRLTKSWTDWVDHWAIDFDYQSRKEIIKVPVGTGVGGVATLPVKRHQELVRWRHEELVHRRHGLISSATLSPPAAAGGLSVAAFCTSPERRFSFSR